MDVRPRLVWFLSRTVKLEDCSSLGSEKPEGKMNRKKLKQSLLLLNLIVLIGLVVFYPTEAAGYTYSSEFERTVNRFISTRQWADIWAIFIISLLSTS